MGTYGAARGKEQTIPYKHFEIHETQGKCIERGEESCFLLGWAKDARILMTIAKTGGLGKKRSGFDIKNQIFHENNTIHSSIVRYIDDC